MSVAWWIVIAAVVIFVVSLVLLGIGRMLPRKDDAEFAETAVHAREGKDPGQD
jgi:hypothetical protein